MSDFAIRTENLGKRYVLRHQGAADRSAGGKGEADEFWALRGVSLDIRPGERVGVIGGNGAGKSTMLKILSRITEPTEGRAAIRGKVSSLLEVGTGFHPELTGRENIFLSGAVLGMRRSDLRARFDEIVAFAGVERFLDTPVKRFSSGMYVRLAFAVAAHLEPEILILDEVLAVGDVQFQRKCLDKMQSIATEGRTILLVSHNMSTILGMSNRCILVEGGRVTMDGAPQDVVGAYYARFTGQAFGRTELSGAEHYGNGRGRFESIRMQPFDVTGAPIPVPVTGCDLEFRTFVRAESELRHATVALTVYDAAGNRLIDANTLIRGDSLSLPGGGEAAVTFRLRNVRLKADSYTVGLWLGVLNDADFDGVRYATSFRMEASREETLYAAPFPGIYACEFEHRIRAGAGPA